MKFKSMAYKSEFHFFLIFGVRRPEGLEFSLKIFLLKKCGGGLSLQPPPFGNYFSYSLLCSFSFFKASCRASSAVRL